MCGRTACNLCPETYQKATSYFDDAKGKYVLPQWIEQSNCGLTFTPSNNVAPKEVTPVLVASEKPDNETKIVIKPMMWGLIPFWQKGDYKSHRLTTNNCRMEGMTTSKLYSASLKLGKRCAIVCEGFYEWQKSQGKGATKQPYFVYHRQKDGVNVEDPSSWSSGKWSADKGWTGPKLLKMAGLFNTWHSPDDEVIYSYSVITTESDDRFSWLHHRVPAILSSSDVVENWLDYQKVDSNEAVSLLKPADSLNWHPVSTIVNNSRNKDPKCNQPQNKSKATSSNPVMEKWLAKCSPIKMKENDQSIHLPQMENPLKKFKK